MPFSLRTLLYTAVALAGSVSADAAPGCQDPGDHMCSFLVYASLLDFPDGSHWTLDDGRFTHVTNGNCEPIETGGDLQPQSPGFYGKIQTSYNTEVEAWASWLSVGQIDGVKIKYGDQNIDQSQCRQDHYGFDPAVTYVQCNFSC